MRLPRVFLVVFTTMLGLLTVIQNSDAATVTRGYATFEAGQLHYRLVGSLDTKRPLIALHLVPNSSQVFAQFMQQMGSGRTVVAFDLPGFGMSDGIQQDTIEGYAKAVMQATESLGFGKIDLLGYHTGAAVAAEINRVNPQLVDQLVLVAIPVLTQEERDRFAALPPIPFDEAGEFAKTEWQRSLVWRGPGQTLDSVKRTFAEKMRPGARERGATAVVQYDLAPVLKELNRSVLVLRPKDDLWEATLRAKPLLPKATWLDYPDYGHGFFETATEELVTIIDDYLGR